MRHGRATVTRLTILLAVVCLAVPVAAADDPDFPLYPEIADHVRFWERVYGEWSLGQVVVHDIDHPALLFEIADLPGPVADTYTDAQRDFTTALRESWEAWLARLESKVKAGDELDELERRWVDEIADRAGPDALEGVHLRVRTQRGVRERFRRGVEISHRYDDRVRAIFRDAGLPEALAYLPHVESSYQAEARSSAGAVGVWQFTRGAARLYMNVDAAVDERLDPIAAAHGAAGYLRDAYARLGSWPIALTSYNHGVAGMARAVEQFGADYPRIFAEYRGRTFGFASKNFYAEFLAARAVAGEPQRWFGDGLVAEGRLPHDEVLLEGRTTPSRIARAYGVALDELAALNPAWSRRAVSAGLPLPEGHRVWLPAGTLDKIALSGRQPDYLLAGWLDDGGAYVVQPGDTLSTIASTYGVGVAELRQLNGMTGRQSLIRVGQRLRLSGEAGESVHVVRSGETLSSIAARYRMGIDDLRVLNGIPAHDNLIRVGQSLTVRGAAPSRVYVVRSGDSLIEIAVRYGVALADLLTLNRLSEASIIHPGQRIRIP